MWASSTCCTSEGAGNECELAFHAVSGALRRCVLRSAGEGLGKVDISLPLSALDSPLALTGFLPELLGFFRRKIFSSTTYSQYVIVVPTHTLVYSTRTYRAPATCQESSWGQTRTRRTWSLPSGGLRSPARKTDSKRVKKKRNKVVAGVAVTIRKIDEGHLGDRDEAGGGQRRQLGRSDM